jgi:hypothetical protein
VADLILPALVPYTPAHHFPVYSLAGPTGYFRISRVSKGATGLVSRVGTVISLA